MQESILQILACILARNFRFEDGARLLKDPQPSSATEQIEGRIIRRSSQVSDRPSSQGLTLNGGRIPTKTLSIEVYMNPRTLIFSALLAIPLIGLPIVSSAANKGSVVEIVTFHLKPSVTAEEFASIDKQVEKQHVAKQLGFVSRESAIGERNEWLVVVHWRSVEDAEASMKSFDKAPAAANFMSKIEASTMIMKRYRVMPK